MQSPPGNAQMNIEVLARARYVAYAQRRTMPPRCNPFGILFLILTLGMLFIGLTMTIIANWPGATTIGENPLRIAGPVLLACGGALLILTLVLIVCLNRYERTKWERQLTNYAADRIKSSYVSREILVTHNRPPISNDQPYRQRFSSSQGDQDPSSSRGSGAYPAKGRYNVEMLPDPLAKTKQPGKLHDVSLDSEDKVPDPMRVQKKRPTSRKSASSNGSVNNSYSSGAGEADLGVPGMLMPPRASQQSSNAGYMNASFESAERQSVEPRSGVRNAKGQQRKRETKEGGKRTAMGGDGEVGTAHNYSGDSQQLRIHIKAQQGTAVHITPTATPPPQQLSRHSRQTAAGRTQMDTSGETEI